MMAIFRRELGSYFSSPVGYVVIAAFLSFSGLFFYYYCLYAGSSNMNIVFQNMFSVVMFIIPILTMRLFAEDRKTKTDQALLTSPVKIGSIVMGKYLSAMIILLICLCSYLVEGLILSFIAHPDWSVILGNVFGMLLLGSVFVSIGIMVSSLTESMVIAAVASFAINILLSLVDTLASTVNTEGARSFISSLSLQTKYNSITLGIISLGDVVYFVTLTALFLFITDRIIERRRWA